MPINPLDNTNSTDGDDQSTDVQTNPISGGATGANANSVGANVSGSSTSASGGSSGTGGAAKPSSTGFTNVNQYVNANADQSAGLGSAIAQNVNKQASQGLQGLSQASQDFGNQLNAQSVNPNNYSAQNVSNTLSNDANASQTTPTASGIQSDIQQYQNVANESNAFKNGTTTAPQTLTAVNSYQPADSQLQQAEQAANLTGTESGRATLLQGGTIQSTDPNNPNAQVNVTGGFARPNYTTGEVNLDQLLTQNTPQNATALGNLRTNLLGQYGLANTENQAIQNAAQQYSGASAGTQQAEQNIQNVLYGIPVGTPVDANGNPITSNSTPPFTSTNPNTNSIQPTGSTAIGIGTSTPNTTANNPVQYGILTNLYNQLLGQPATATTQQQTSLANNQTLLTNYLTQQYGSSIEGIPISQIVSSILSPNSTGTASITNTMTPAQLNELQTLNQFGGLTGTNINQIGQTGGANTQVIDPTTIGTYQFNSGNTLNTSTEEAALAQKSGQYDSDVSTAVNQINQGTNYQVYGQTLQGSAGVAQAINRVNAKMSDPNYDIAQQQALNTALQSNLSNINSLRSNYGLPAVPPPDQDTVNAATQQMWTTIAAEHDQALNLPPSNNAGAQFVTMLQSSSDPKSVAFRSAVSAAAQNTALNNLISSIGSAPEQFNQTPNLNSLNLQGILGG